jgi:hypothetical protein
MIPLGIIGASGAASPAPTSNTIALLHFDGADGATSVTDETGKTWTVAGSAQLDTDWSKFGASSLLLPSGTGHYIECTDAELAFGTSDFCIELWFRLIGMNNPNLMDNRFGGEGSASQVIYDSLSGASVNMMGFAAGSNRFSTGSLSASTTYHLAWARSSGTSRLFLDGTQVGSNYTDGNNYTSTKLRFGQNYLNNASGWDGWIDELRISRVARYSSNFTPPGSAFTLD